MAARVLGGLPLVTTETSGESDVVDEIVELTDLLRRVVASRVRDRDIADDIVQEALTRLLAARDRLDVRAVGPYAVVTARNLITSRSAAGRDREAQ